MDHNLFIIMMFYIYIELFNIHYFLQCTIPFLVQHDCFSSGLIFARIRTSFFLCLPLSRYVIDY